MRISVVTELIENNDDVHNTCIFMHVCSATHHISMNGHLLTHSLAPKANHLGELKQVSRLDASSVVQPSDSTTLRASNQVQQSLY